MINVVQMTWKFFKLKNQR